MKIEKRKKQYGVVFRVPNADKTSAVLLCQRKTNAWERNPLQIDDSNGRYGTLGGEQLAVVEVVQAGTGVDIKDLVRVGITEDDGAVDVLDAIQKGILFEIAEKAVRHIVASEAKAAKEADAKPLKSLVDQDTYILDTWLAEKFEPPKEAVDNADEIKRMLVEIIGQTVMDQLTRAKPMEPMTAEQQTARTLEIQATAKSAKEKFAEFITPFQKGDEFWFFKSGRASWLAFQGRAGYVILRNRKVVAAYLTRRQ